MRGRHPTGPEYVRQRGGSAQAKERFITIMDTFYERCRVLEACQRLGISEARFYQLRDEAVDGAVQNLEARPAGRPRRIDSESAARIRALEEEVQALKIELRAAQTRAEIALALPHLTVAEMDKKKRNVRNKPRSR